MQGEYRGDFTRDTFHRANHFSRVLMQQGRVQLDADSNEQTAILLHHIRSLAADLIGPHGGPDNSGFAIATSENTPEDFQIGFGHYYIDGLLCENEPRFNAAGASVPSTYFSQADYPRDKETNALTDEDMLVYLDVWERHVTWAQQDLLREVALGGPDTATRAQVVWQVRVATTLPPGVDGWPAGKLDDDAWRRWVAGWQAANRGHLKAQVQRQLGSTDPCVISPGSRYRGTENQLYRVEIHRGGALPGPAGAAAPSYKWSRENASVFFPILKLGTSAGQTTITLANLGRDSRLSLKSNDWVELVDDNSVASGLDEPLLKVVAVDPTTQMVTLAGTSSLVVNQPSASHPILRRWDGTGAIAESSGNLASDWLALEDGIQIQFQPPTANAAGAAYRAGDYWLIPARVATGTVEWPQSPDNQSPAALPPHGVEHHYAPLAYLPHGPATTAAQVLSLRRIFPHLAV